MINKKSTKRALLASVLSLALCFAMLVGSTFAWFTDSATTGVNKIVSGNLDVSLEKAVAWDADGNPTEWEPAEKETLTFRTVDNREAKDILWEPGCTYALPELRVVNNGNLALKYKVVITGITGNAKLNEVIDWTIEYGYNGEEGEGYLAAGEKAVDPIFISGHMQETAGVEYMDLSIDGISVTVIATQDDVENDSYGNTYDEDADGTPDHPEYVSVSSTAELKDAMTNAGANDVIFLNSGKYEITEDIKTDGTFEVAEGADVILKLDGNKITTNASSNNDEVKVNEPTVLNKGNLTIDGGTIENKNATAGNTNVAAVRNVGGTMTLKNCKIENVSPTSGGDYAVVVTGGKVILENCTVKGNRGAISVSGSGSIEMTGGSVSANVYYPLYIGGTGASTFTNVTFTKLNNSKGKAITYNVFEKDAGSATFTGCTFTTERSSEISFDISGKTTGVTFDNCTFTKVKNPNV